MKFHSTCAALLPALLVWSCASGQPGSGDGAGVATVNKTDEWNNGYCADVLVSGVSEWTVVLDMRNSAIANGQLWDASYTTSGNILTATGKASKFRFCANKTSDSDWLPIVKSVSGTSTAGPTTGGNSGSSGRPSSGSSGRPSGGTSGEASSGRASSGRASSGRPSSGGASGAASSGRPSSGGSSGSSSNGESCPAINGTPGFTTRFWDCCKPHCGWADNVPGGAALKSCNASNQSNGSDYSMASSCAGGEAYVCYGLTPWAVSDKLAYGWAATPTGTNSCGKCYAIQFTGTGHSGEDPGSAALKGKTIIVQTINVGGDVSNNQFDIMVPGGGVGLFNACSKQWKVSNSDLGEQYGGLLAVCRKQSDYKGSLAETQECLREKCNSLFTDARGLGTLREGCLFYADWYMAADNPNMVYKEVTCPAELQQKSGLKVGGTASSACGG